MGFADRYIQRNINYPAFEDEPPSARLGMVIVIPVFNEPDLLKTINSLAECQPPEQDVEVMVVVNQSEKSPPEITRQNQKTSQELAVWKQQNDNVFFRLRVLQPPPFRKKHAGAGLARKTGMDEAVRRFAAVEKEDGVIISLDADTLVEENYLVEIEKHFRKAKKQVGATIRFKHLLDDIENDRHRRGMELYEMYLHYYKRAMEFTGFPNAIYTVGSAFVVRVLAYTKQGGMNRKQAGEDFYFLHKLAQFGSIGEISSTCVYPSPRISKRVPFGTGPMLQKWMDGDETLRQTYHFRAFVDLKKLFDLVPQLFELPVDEVKSRLKTLPKPVAAFLVEDEFEQALLEIRSNAARFSSFEKRFYGYFNAFKILKFLNFSHPSFYDFQDLKEAVRELNAASKN